MNDRDQPATRFAEDVTVRDAVELGEDQPGDGMPATLSLGRTMSDLQTTTWQEGPTDEEQWSAEIEMAADESGFNPDLRLTGNRRALRGEKLLLVVEADGAADGAQPPCQVTNYRVLLYQEATFWHSPVAIDAWIKDVSTVEVRDAGYNQVLMVTAAVLLVGGAVNKRSLEGVNFDSEQVVYFSMAPVGFFLIGLFFVLWAYLARGIVIAIGVVGQHRDATFEVNIREEDRLRVAQCIDLIRVLQMPEAMRRQREGKDVPSQGHRRNNSGQGRRGKDVYTRQGRRSS